MISTKEPPFHPKPPSSAHNFVNTMLIAEVHSQFLQHYELLDPKIEPPPSPTTTDSIDPLDIEPSSDAQQPVRPAAGDQASARQLYFCPVCQRAFAQLLEMRTHAKMHGNSQASKHGADVNLQCIHCQRSYRNLQAYRRHVRTHFSQPMFFCPHCSRHFHSRYDYNRHQTTHSGEKPFRCTICSHSFTQSSSLNTHMRSHDASGQKWSSCRLCDYSSPVHSNVTRHMRAVHKMGSRKRLA